MDEYIYAGKGWEPEIGNVCEVEYDFGKWKECVIVELGNPRRLPCSQPAVDYTVDIPGYPCQTGISPLWLCYRADLRKPRPPQQDDKLADEDFITDLKSLLNREGVKA